MSIAIILTAAAAAAASGGPEVLLDPLFQERCRRPCEYVGYSFDDSLEELRLMHAAGANAAGSGSMWVPVEDPAAPYGAGVGSVQALLGAARLGQSFTVDRAISGVAVATPTFFTEGSGCTLALYRGAPEEWRDPPPEPLAQQTFSGVRDNERLWLTFPEALPGAYYLELSQPTGPGIGAWAVGGDAYPRGRAYLNRRPEPGDDLELWVRSQGEERALVPPVEAHHPIRLGASAREQMAELGMSLDYAVGNWNNGGFPYYPEWFLRRFPDVGEIDQDGRPVLAGMFGAEAPWPSNDHPVIVDGTRRYLRAVVSRLREERNLLFWCMGGEALYATYLFPDRWTDYGANAVAHYRAWLQQRYGTIGALNAAWGTQHAEFAAISPPKPPGRDLPSLDWFRHRNAAMAERFAWHFAEIKGADPTRLAMTCNHGNLFQELAATRLGQDLQLYAAVSDGWEMGQIMADEDSDRYNLMWMRTAGTFGKPLCPVRLAYRKSNPKARGGGTSYTPEAARRYFYESVGTGAWHLGFIQWRGSLPDGEWGVKGTPAEPELARLFAEWRRLEPCFDDAWPVKEKVGLYFSQPTWTLDGFAPLWTRLHREFTERQIGYRVLCDEQVLSGDLSDCAVVISADNGVMSSECASALRRYADSGGRLVLVGENGREDEQLRPRASDPFGDRAVRWPADSPTLVDDLAKLIEDRRARYLRVEATSDEPFFGSQAEWTTTGHDTPFDLAEVRSLGQSFTTTADGLSAVAVSVPTYTKTVTGTTLTIEMLTGGPTGRKIATRTFPAEDLTDNAWHEVAVSPPAPAGRYAVRLVTPEGLPPQTLGVWGRRADAYPGGTRQADDAPAGGDLEVKLTFRVPRPARAALEAFTLSDGVNALVLLTNVSGREVRATVDASPDLLPAEVREVRATEAATGRDLGPLPRGKLRVSTPVPGHRTAILFLAAEPDASVPARLARLEAELQPLPAAATSAPRAHLARAREALAAVRAYGHAGTNGALAKARACLQRAEERVPALVEAEVSGNALQVRAKCFGAGRLPATLEARFVPLPGKTLRLAPTGTPGEYRGAMALSDLGVRYDYAAQRYVPYFGALEVTVSGRAGARTAAAACVVNVPERKGVAP